MPTPPEVMSAHAQNPGGLAAPVAGGVADDLHAIFPHAPPRAGTSQMRFGFREVGRKRSPKRVAAAGAMIAAALGGLSAGAMLGRSPSTEIHRPKPASAPMTAQRQIAITVTGKSQLTSAVAPEGLPNPGPLAPPQLQGVDRAANPCAGGEGEDPGEGPTLEQGAEPELRLAGPDFTRAEGALPRGRMRLRRCHGGRCAPAPSLQFGAQQRRLAAGHGWLSKRMVRPAQAGVRSAGAGGVALQCDGGGFGAIFGGTGA